MSTDNVAAFPDPIRFVREQLAAERVKSAVALGILADLLRSANAGRLGLDGDDLVRRARECLIYE